MQEQSQTTHEATVQGNTVEASAAQNAVVQEQTLHDFVLNLLNDSAARAAFAQDPANALGCAGLGDVTAQDVQEVVPLVMDYGQLPDAGALTSGLGGLPVGADGIDGAIQQLQSVALAASEHRFDTTEVGVLDGGLASGVGEFGGVGTAGLDGVAAAVSMATEVAAAEAMGELSADGASFGSHVDSIAGHGAAFGGAGLGGAGGGAALENDFASGGGTLDAGLGGVTGDAAVESEHATVGAFGAASAAGAAGGAAVGTDALDAEASAAVSPDAFAAGGSIDSPLGAYGVEVAGGTSGSLPEVNTTGALADVFDTEALNRGSEAAASTVATYVTSGGAALGGIAPVNALDAPQMATTLPANVPADLPAAVPAGLPTDVTGVTGALPDAGSLPVDVPVDVPADVPGGLPLDLPVDLPVANPLPSPHDLPGVENVADVVSQSPLGGVADTAHQLPLPDAPSTGDLDLGL